MRLAAPAHPEHDLEGRPLAVPPNLASAAAALEAYAAFGGPTDSLARLANEVVALSKSWASPDYRAAAQAALLHVPVRLAYDLLTPAITALVPAHDDRLLAMYRAVRENDGSRVRLIYDTLRTLRAGNRPGDLPMDEAFLEARLLLAVGDTARATELLDASLGALPFTDAHVLDFVGQAAAVGRTAALRARLDEMAGVSAAGARSRERLRQLWRLNVPSPLADRQ
jgi:hypothetical protein